MIKSAYLESRILSADPIELVAILYEHAILSTAEARECLSRRDIAGRTARVSRVIAILGELEGSLDHAAGGEISVNLARLYQYMRERLLMANLKQQDEPLAEVEKLLETLAEGWEGVVKSRRTEEVKPAVVTSGSYSAPLFEPPVWQASAWQMGSAGNSQAWTA